MFPINPMILTHRKSDVEKFYDALILSVCREKFGLLDLVNYLDSQIVAVELGHQVNSTGKRAHFLNQINCYTQTFLGWIGIRL
jgi:hypothetical protein